MNNLAVYLKFHKVGAVCPYCGFTNKFKLEDVARGHFNVVYCDVEEGGCDCQFAFKVEANIELKVINATIEPVVEKKTDNLQLYAQG